MRRLALPLLVLALLAATPAVRAGGEDDPEIRSPRDRDSFRGDLLAVWMEHHPDGLKVTFKVGGLGPRDTLAVYDVEFTLDGRRHSPAIGLDRDGRVRTDSGENPDGWGGPRSPARVDDRLLDPQVRRGEPAYVSFVVPWGLYPGLAPGATVRPVEAGSAIFDGRTQRWLPGYDQADARAQTFVVQPAPEALRLPIVVPAWVIPTLVVGCTLLGAGAGFAVSRLTRRSPPARAPPAALADGGTARAPPRPPGERFRVDPGPPAR